MALKDILGREEPTEKERKLAQTITYQCQLDMDTSISNELTGYWKIYPESSSVQTSEITTEKEQPTNGKQTNMEYWYKNHKMLMRQYPEHFIAICDGSIVVIERDHDKFTEEVEKKYYDKRTLQVYIPSSKPKDKDIDNIEDILELDISDE